MNTINEIYNELKSAFETESGIELKDGGDMALRFRALAVQLVSLQAQAEFVQRQCFPQTAGGEALDTHAMQRGLRRTAAEKAQGALRFSLNEAVTADIKVPKGTRCIAPDETEFEVTSDTVIPAGRTYCDAPAEAVLAGAKGNAPANTVIFMALPPVGVAAVTNPEAFRGGRDAESDEELRTRVLDSYSNIINSGNASYYINQALTVDGVVAATVQPRHRGRGTVDVIVATESGVPSAIILSRVSSKMNGRREICVDVDVKAPTVRAVNVDVDIYTEDNCDAGTVCLQVENTIRAYFSGRLLGKGVSKAALGNLIFGVEGVKNYSFNEPVADLAASPAMLPVLGEFSVSEA